MKIKSCILFIAFATSSLFAHDHIDVGLQEEFSNQLSLSGPDYQLALLVPVGEPFSNYAPLFPGGYYANELTFTTESEVLYAPIGADPTIEILSVVGPVGGVFSFWELNETSPTWSRPTGWTSGSPAVPALIPVIFGGDSHVHGRVFTANKAGTYTITYRAYDDNEIYLSSSPKVLTFQVLDPPQLQISSQAGNVLLSFKSRNLLNYDIQSSTTLAPGSWTTVEGMEAIQGNGTVVQKQDPLDARPKVFYRIVEYR